MSAADMDRYLSQLHEPARATLQELRETILRIGPGAEECISYGNPASRLPPRSQPRAGCGRERATTEASRRNGRGRGACWHRQLDGTSRRGRRHSRSRATRRGTWSRPAWVRRRL